MGKRKTADQWKKQASEIHDNKYDYSLWPENIKISTEITSICPDHGVFTQTIKRHITSKVGCKECGKNKKKETFLEKYGVEHPMKCKKVLEKNRQTLNKNYGVNNPGTSSEIQEKIKQTNVKRYGVEHPLQNDNIKQKQKETIKQKYGVDNIRHIDGVPEKIKQTNMEKYNGVAPACDEEVVKKMKQTTRDRHGVDNINKQHISQQTLNKLNNKEWLINQHHIQQKPLIQIAEELNLLSDVTVGNYLRKFNIKTKYFQQSIGEKQLGEFIQSLGVVVDLNTRSIIYPYEIDIFLPEYNIAIEYNGDYWHGDDFPEHQERDKKKQILCEQQNILLMIIWESDWNSNNNGVKQMIEDFINTSNEKRL